MNDTKETRGEALLAHVNKRKRSLEDLKKAWVITKDLLDEAKENGWRTDCLAQAESALLGALRNVRMELGLDPDSFSYLRHDRRMTRLY